MAAHLAHLAAVELGQILALEDDLTAGWLVELENRSTGCGLAATGLTHEAKGLARFTENEMPSTA